MDNRRNDPPPHRRPVQVALVEHGVGLHGGLDSSGFTVLLDQSVGGAIDVEVGEHLASLDQVVAFNRTTSAIFLSAHSASDAHCSDSDPTPRARPINSWYEIAVSGT